MVVSVSCFRTTGVPPPDHDRARIPGVGKEVPDESTGSEAEMEKNSGKNFTN